MPEKTGDFASPLLIQELDALYGSAQKQKEPVKLRQSRDVTKILTQIKEEQQKATETRVSFK